MRLSKRLEAIKTLCIAYSHHGRFADIGSDHALLPIALMEDNHFEMAVASDVAEGPIEAGRINVLENHLEDKIECRLGSGLKTLENDVHYDVVAICGMGGYLMCDILNEDLNSKDITTLVLEPNNNEPTVRKTLQTLGWHLEDECTIEDGHHYYEILVFQKGKVVDLSKEELYFGPFQLKHRQPDFIKKWQKQLTIHEGIYASLTEEHQKRRRIQDEIIMMKEVLKDEAR